MRSRLTTLKMYLDNESLTGDTRRRAVAYQVRAILHGLDDELEQDRGAILDYLRLLGFSDLIAEYR